MDTDERGPVSFRYTARALDEPDRFALSVRLSVRPEPYGHQEAMASFDDLLPESDARERTRNRRPGNTGAAFPIPPGSRPGAPTAARPGPRRRPAGAAALAGFGDGSSAPLRATPRPATDRLSKMHELDVCSDAGHEFPFEKGDGG